MLTGTANREHSIAPGRSTGHEPVLRPRSLAGNLRLYLRFWLGICSACHEPRPLCRFPRYWATSGCHLVWGLDG
jgi:hypothetical protein